MINRKVNAHVRKKLLPVLVAGAISIAGCSGEQAGDTNAGISGGLAGGGLSTTTVVGVVGGVALASLLLDSDDSNGISNNDGTDGTDGGTGGGTAGGTGGGTVGGTGGGTVGGTGGGTDGGTGGGTDGGTGGGTDGGTGGGTDGGTGGGTDGGTGGGTDGGTGGGTDGGTGGGTDGGTGGGTDGGTGGGTDGGTGGGTDGGTGGGTAGGTGGGTDGGTGGGTDGGTGGGTDGGTGGGTDGGTGGGTDGGTGGGTDGGTGGSADDGTGGTDGGAGGAVLSDDGVVQADLVQEQAVPATGSFGSGTVNMTFNRSTGDASGTVTLSGITADRVDIMVGPPGANGFVAVELEMISATQWQVPTSLSAAQTAFILKNLNSGNLYVAARNSSYPEGEVRRQLTPGGVTQYTTSGNNASGTAAGYLLVNETTGAYSFTWNTTDPTLVSAHVNDGVVSGATEGTYAQLTHRTSNPSRFFLDGNFNDAADPLYPDLLTRLDAGTVWLDAHSADDTRVFFEQLSQ